jgi:putative ABC transport system substrate-binding protein
MRREPGPPRSNITGFSLGAGEGVGERWLELLKPAVPGLSRVASLRIAANAVSLARVQEMQQMAPELGLHVQAMEVRSPTDFEDAFAAMTQAHIDAFFVGVDPPLSPVPHADCGAGSHPPAAAVIVG